MLVLITVAAACALLVSPSFAAQPVYGVMNTSEYPPDGIYFRDAPDWNTYRAITGFGFYAGDSLRLLCSQSGSNVPRRDRGSNLLWYKAENVTKPRTPQNAANTGWVNAHFVNDGMRPNEVAPGVTPCADGPSSPSGPSGGGPIVGGASVYYSPFDGDWISSFSSKGFYLKYVKSVTNETFFHKQWDAGCGNTSKTGNFPATIDGKPASTLTGWSSGRNGPIGFLFGNPGRTSQIHYILLFDPGTKKELGNDDACFSGKGKSGAITAKLAEWLRSNPSNRLAILAGDTTRDQKNVDIVGGKAYAHAGLQDTYFPAIRGNAAMSKQVTVCNYDGMSHPDVWTNFQDWANRAPVDGICPIRSGVPAANFTWHP